jgi:hypothetical protein
MGQTVLQSTTNIQLVMMGNWFARLNSARHVVLVFSLQNTQTANRVADVVTPK